MLKIKIEDDFRKFIEKINNKFKPCKIILFGSRARDNFLKNSDYDVIVVSDKFKGIHFLDRMKLIYEFWNKMEHLDVLCYTVEEFKRKEKEIGTVSKALEEGILLVGGDL
ncbi:nucleotidyltransferase [Archaeoglobales archaeon]|nr:MAG: nucleotidyltransferase [Archaeoglobales archaeon]